MPADPSARHVLSRLMAGVDVHPTSLPPSAVLLVRRVSDPAPRSLESRDPGLHPPAKWARALQSAIDRAAREAARPAHGPVPANADSVLFLDPAELLACLARDFLVGDVSGSWWWQAWLRTTGRSTLEIVLSAWVRDARHAPAAIGILDNDGLAVPFVRALSAHDARTLLVGLAEAYELPGICAPRVEPEAARAKGVNVAPLSSTPSAGDSGEPAGESGRNAAPPAPPWERLIPASRLAPGLDLEVEQRTLLGIALSLWHAPLAVRAREFQRRLHAWRSFVRSRARRPTAERSDGRPPASPALAHLIPRPRPPNTDRSPDASVDIATELQGVETALLSQDRIESPADARVQREHAAVEQDGPRLDRIARGSPVSRSAPAPIETTGDDEPRLEVVDTRPASAAREPRTVGELPREPEVEPPAGDHSAPAVGPLPQPNIRTNAAVTELGGVLFLVNALQRLELFDRLDDHFEIVSPAGAWAWFEMIARSLLGSVRAGSADDPLWRALAALDERPPDAEIAGEFRGPTPWRLPHAWHAPARLPRLRRRPLAFDPPCELLDFLGLLTGYLRWRLLRALAFGARTRREQDALLASRLLCRHARIEWTATHVDVHMDMSQIDIAVRLAGLDANPGWVPALARVVTFYFD